MSRTENTWYERVPPPIWYAVFFECLRSTERAAAQYANFLSSGTQTSTLSLNLCMHFEHETRKLLPYTEI